MSDVAPSRSALYFNLTAIVALIVEAIRPGRGLPAFFVAIVGFFIAAVVGALADGGEVLRSTEGATPPKPPSH